jgi:hypothetical protein
LIRAAKTRHAYSHARHVAGAAPSPDCRKPCESAGARVGAYIGRRYFRYGFGVAYHQIDHEVRLPEVHGRADTLFGSVVFEFKRDLRQEHTDVATRLPDYLSDRERQTGRRFLGIATDGATFLAYELRQSELVEIGRHEPNSVRPEALLAWLEPALSNRDDLIPDPLTVERELGRSSLSFGRARGVLERLWGELRVHSEVVLKRQLWDGLLREAYGTPVGDDALFLQHTYLTIVAKTIACRVLDLPADDAGSILSGRALDEVGIQGAVESDFFDWILELVDGRDLVVRIARQTARFRLRDVQADVLKSLYESLIDPTQRHDLGEYYTPDWLAAKVTARALADPLTQRVLDPACGSGTFLFHAIRRKLAAADAVGLTRRRQWRHAYSRFVAWMCTLLRLSSHESLGCSHWVRQSRTGSANCMSPSTSGTQCNGTCVRSAIRGMS